MDVFSAFFSPFATGNQIDVEDDEGGRFYGSDGEATNLDHRIFQEGATFGDPGYRKTSGKYVPVDQLRGRHIAPAH